MCVIVTEVTSLGLPNGIQYITWSEVIIYIYIFIIFIHFITVVQLLYQIRTLLEFVDTLQINTKEMHA